MARASGRSVGEDIAALSGKPFREREVRRASGGREEEFQQTEKSGGVLGKYRPRRDRVLGLPVPPDLVQRGAGRGGRWPDSVVDR
jgi:hypothetical protein